MLLSWAPLYYQKKEHNKAKIQGVCRVYKKITVEGLVLWEITLATTL